MISGRCHRKHDGTLLCRAASVSPQGLRTRQPGRSNMPFGEKLWEEISKAASRRIHDVSERGVHEEVSFVGEITGLGRLKGLKGRIVGTDNYWEKITEENVIHGNANGLLTLQGKNEGA